MKHFLSRGKFIFDSMCCKKFYTKETNTVHVYI